MPSKYYKVVRIKKRKKLSYVAHFSKNTEIVYPLGKWVSPKIPNSKLFVFTDFDKAKHLASSSVYPCAVYECEVKCPETIRVRLTYWLFGSRTCLWDFWKKPRPLPSAWVMPEINIVASEVKITKRVFRNKLRKKVNY